MQDPHQEAAISSDSKDTKELALIPTLPYVPPDANLARKRVEMIQFSVVLVAMFTIGYQDGATGPLLPRIQAEYHVGFTIVSLVFILSTTVVLGATFQAAAFIIASTAPPFPAFVFSFSLAGFGRSMQDSQINGYVAGLKENGASKMGILHAIYGVGALVSPAISTQFAQISRWSFFYFTSLGVMVTDITLLVLVFRFRTQDECLQEIGQPPADTGENEGSHYKQILRLKTVWLLTIFLFCYVGLEETMGSWTVTYIIQVRNGGPSSGYISTGFFGGLTVGRIALLPVNKKVGEDKVTFIYILVAIALEFIIWFVPSLVVNAICVALIGVVLGPMFPIAINHAGRVLPPWLLTGSIGIMAGFAATGSASVPFMTGAIASKAGIKAMQPLMVGMSGLLFSLWGLVYFRAGVILR